MYNMLWLGMSNPNPCTPFCMFISNNDSNYFFWLSLIEFKQVPPWSEVSTMNQSSSFEKNSINPANIPNLDAVYANGNKYECVLSALKQCLM